MIVRDEILTVAEVAADLRCSKAHIYNVINGKVSGVTALPAITMGRRRLVRRSSLEHWKNANEQSRSDAMMRPAHSVDAALGA
jgi:excisionase family DNA binding protein